MIRNTKRKRSQQHRNNGATPDEAEWQSLTGIHKITFQTHLSLHFSPHTYHDGVIWEPGMDGSHELHEMLRVAISHIQADILDEGNSLYYVGHPLKVSCSTSRAHGYMLERGGKKIQSVS